MESARRLRAISFPAALLLAMLSSRMCSAASPKLQVAPPVPSAASRNAGAVLQYSFGEGAGRGDLITIPITIAGTSHLFVVDTGSPGVVLDSKLAKALEPTIGPPISTSTVKSSSGAEVKLSIYKAPALESDGQILLNEFQNIASSDLTIAREAMGKPVEGILGMHVLGHYVVSINFQQRRLTLEDPSNAQIPKGEGFVRFPILSPSGLPMINVSIGGLPERPLVVDTGGDHAFSLTAEALQQLPEGSLQRFATHVADLAGATQRLDDLLGTAWKFCGVGYEKTWIEESASNSIGLRCLSDFHVVFDFQRGWLYLKPLRAVHPVEPPRPRIGISFAEGAPRVKFADGGLAEVQTGDEIVAVGGSPANRMEPWQIRDRIRADAPVVITFRRGGKEFTQTLLPTPLPK